MVKIACCYNCAFAYLDREHTVECVEKGLLNWPACANYPESYGRMQRTPPRGICENYRPREGRPQGDVRQIPLGRAYYAYVDAADYEWLSRWTWSFAGGYAVRVEKKKKLIYMHREIMHTPKGKVVDHKNRNKLDNTRANLHNCTHSENAQNRPTRRGTSSRFLGVSYHVNRNLYQVRLCYRGRIHSIGYFADEIEAARAHDYREVQVLGEAARLNFPREWPPERRAEVYAQPEAAEARKQANRKAQRRRSGAGKQARPRT